VVTRKLLDVLAEAKASVRTFFISQNNHKNS